MMKHHGLDRSVACDADRVENRRSQRRGLKGGDHREIERAIGKAIRDPRRYIDHDLHTRISAQPMNEGLNIEVGKEADTKPGIHGWTPRYRGFRNRWRTRGRSGFGPVRWNRMISTKFIFIGDLRIHISKSKQLASHKYLAKANKVWLLKSP